MDWFLYNRDLRHKRVKISDSSIQHFSDGILSIKRLISNTHALFYISTSCLESENEVLQDYVSRLSLQRQIQDTILGYSKPKSTFNSRNQSIFASVESLMMKLLMERLLIFPRYQLSTNAMIS